MHFLTPRVDRVHHGAMAKRQSHLSMMQFITEVRAHIMLRSVGLQLETGQKSF